MQLSLTLLSDSPFTDYRIPDAILFTVFGLYPLPVVLALLTNTSRLVPHVPDPHQAWLTLAMSSTPAGNLTLLSQTLSRTDSR